jgi:hypothetical protein
MSDNNNSLINLGDLSKPADTLIKKISNAVGGIFAPHQIKRLAKAEAEAAIIKAQTEIQITDLHRRAMHRFVEEEAKKQEAIEAIASKAIPHLSESSDAAKMADDWVTNFFDKSRIVSDDDMQNIWARVLAGEANRPGSYSKRTVNLLGDLDKSDAELFVKLCAFAWHLGLIIPLVFETEDDIYEKNGITFSALTHLESIGLVRFENLTGFRSKGLPKTFSVFYYGSPLQLEMPKDSNNELNIGKVLLTKAGQELASICGSRPVDGFMEYVKGKWKAFSPKDVTAQANAPTSSQSEGNRS